MSVMLRAWPCCSGLPSKKALYAPKILLVEVLKGEPTWVDAPVENDLPEDPIDSDMIKNDPPEEPAGIQIFLNPID